MRIPAILFVAMMLGGCDRGVPMPGPAPGPVPLRDAAHMRQYLAGASWTRRSDGEHEHWSFDSDGSCKAWVLPGSSMTLAEFTGLPGLPVDATLLTASWTVTEDMLTLTRIRTEHGTDVPDGTIPLHWVDGKLRIGIGPHRFMRRLGAN